MFDLVKNIHETDIIEAKSNESKHYTEREKIESEVKLGVWKHNALI